MKFRPSLLTALFLASFASSTSAQTMQTLLTNGPASNRLNLVVLSEGYTTNQLGQFLVDATNAINTLFSHPPYQEYKPYCNAFAISVASTDSGSDHPAYPQYRNTYFNSTYDQFSDFFLTIPPNDLDTNYSHGQGKIDSLIQTLMPQCHLPVLLVNDIVPGGSDGFDKTAVSSIALSSSEILAHETGHVLANLGDEYTDPYPGFPDTEEPNTTQQTNLNSIKWKLWISTNTPIPTPSTSAYSTNIGLFQGAHYHTTNWYRPQLNCAMGSLGSPFCAVCSEALVLSIYQKVRPIDTFSPAATNLSVSSTQALSFNLTCLQPATHSLTIKWFTNGTAITGATNSTFTLYPQSLPNGTNIVSALVKDPTSLVRNDPTNVLSQTLTWSLNVNLPKLQLDSPLWLSGGKFAFRVTGTAPQGFVILASTNATVWTPLVTNSLVSGQFWYTNPTASTFSKRFFRASTPP